MARLSWLEFNNTIEKKTIEPKQILFDCFSSEYLAYYQKFSFFQSYQWYTKCPYSECLVNKSQRSLSSAFILRFFFFYVLL